MGRVVTPKRRLVEAYKYAGFRPRATIREVEDDRGTLVVSLERRSKKACAVFADRSEEVGTIAGCAGSATWAVAATGCCWSSRSGALRVAAAAGGRASFLSGHPPYTERFSMGGGGRRR